MFKKLLKTIMIYLAYLLMTIIIFYITGLYAFNQPPTNIVLLRMLLFPLLLTLLTIIVMFIIKKLKK